MEKQLWKLRLNRIVRRTCEVCYWTSVAVTVVMEVFAVLHDDLALMFKASAMLGIVALFLFKWLELLRDARVLLNEE